MIEIINLTKKFNGIPAFKNITLKFEASDRIAIVGSNGAGKTTLIETIIGVNKQTSGEVKFKFKFHKSPLEKIGVQFQDSEYPEGLTTQDIIEFFTSVSLNRMTEEEIQNIILIFQMNDFLHTDARSLSGGQKQKLNVLLAFVSNPEIIFLDELTTGLDIKVRKSITDFVKSFLDRKKSTLILVSHNEHEIEKLCNKIIVMQKGEIVFNDKITIAKRKYGSIAELMERYI